MAESQILLADDVSDRSDHGKKRSRLLRALGLELARRLSANIDAIFVMPVSPKKFKEPEQLDWLEQEISKKKDDFKKSFLKSLPAVSSHVLLGKPVEAILSFEKTEGPYQMILLGCKERKGLNKINLGGVAEEIARNARGPILILGPEAQKVDFKIDPKKKNIKILVLTDLGSASEKAEDCAMKLCKSLDAESVLFHSVGDSILHLKKSFYGFHYVPVNIDKICEKMKNKAKELLALRLKWWDEADLLAKSILIEKEDDVGNSFAKEILKGYDLVIVGSHERSKVVKAIIGSTARKIIMTSPIPVLVVRSI